ncbi:nuclease-related domain-containing protein [Streptomyces gobiensis]|uniref:nuclease-related domain-containing protein n=1 Tax=Streptomyces gobiensis TaxID=2875706 RepID=UPI001E38C2F1|nr:NERD domain-containing protein [Streptomyces gobiensis]UGY94674.1 NERD domain-containing protein [Streptomyces gobiensis]
MKEPYGSGPLWLHPDDDLAPNRPGESLYAKVESAPQGRAPGWLARLLGRPSEAQEWRRALLGAQIAGAELERLTGRGCRVLHSIPLPGGVDIGQLLIGPGGVFSFHVRHHRKARIRVGDDSVRIGTGRPRPYVRQSRREAVRAAHALTRGCGFPVEVRPVLVLVAAARVIVAPTLRDVWVLRTRDLAALGSRGGVLKPADIEAIHSTARDRRTWLNA